MANVTVRQVDAKGRNLGEFAPLPVRRNVVDRVVSFFAPKAALERQRARIGLSFLSGFSGGFGRGGFIAARTDRPATRHWRPNGGSPDADILPDLPTLRSRSRDAERNEPIATAAIGTSVTEVIGTGLVPRAQVDAKYLGLSEEEAAAWQEQAERVWWWWWHNCDLTRSQTFGELQGLAFRGVLSSGDVLVVRRQRPRPGDLLGLKLQVVEADRISNPNHRPDTHRLRAGIEFDDDGAPVRFHIADTHPGERWRLAPGAMTWSPVPAFGRSGGRLALHLFDKLRPGQSRGYPYLAPVLEPLRELGDFRKAELDAAVINGILAGFVKTPAPEDGGSLNPLATLSDEEKAEDTARGEITMGSGTIAELGPGEEIEFVDPSRPNVQFDPFFVAVVRQIGAAIEMPFEILLKHFTASYSASRAAFLQAAKFIRRRRTWTIDTFAQPSYEWVIEEAVARGILRAPGFFEDPLARMAWTQAEWTGPAMGQIDPVKEVKAWADMEDRGYATASEATAALTGGDWEMKLARRAREKRLREDAGLGAAAAPAPAAAPGPPDPDPDADPDEADELERREVAA